MGEIGSSHLDFGAVQIWNDISQLSDSVILE